jgi:thymidylate kinase
MLDLFDKVFFLKTPPDILVERLRNARRDNPMGRTDYQVEYSLYWARRNEEIASKLHIPMLDASKSPEQTFSKIREEVVE